jgi:hypothetical protein
VEENARLSGTGKGINVVGCSFRIKEPECRDRASVSVATFSSPFLKWGNFLRKFPHVFSNLSFDHDAFWVAWMRPKRACIATQLIWHTPPVSQRAPRRTDKE